MHVIGRVHGWVAAGPQLCVAGWQLGHSCGVWLHRRHLLQGRVVVAMPAVTATVAGTAETAVCIMYGLSNWLQAVQIACYIKAVSALLQALMPKVAHCTLLAAHEATKERKEDNCAVGQALASVLQAWQPAVLPARQLAGV